MPATAAAGGMWTADLRAAAPIEYTLPDIPTPLPRIYAFPSQGVSALTASSSIRTARPRPTPRRSR